MTAEVPVTRCPPGDALNARNAWPQCASVAYGFPMLLEAVWRAGSSGTYPNTAAMAVHARLYREGERTMHTNIRTNRKQERATRAAARQLGL